MLFLDKKHTNTSLIYENSLINNFNSKRKTTNIFKKSANQLFSPALAWTKLMLKFSSALARTKSRLKFNSALAGTRSMLNI